MKSAIQAFIPLVLTILSLTLLTNAAQADYDYFSDRLSREYRDAGDVDDWIERGNATVSASPRFENGVRLAAWASGLDGEGNYEFAIASGIYFFEVPRSAQYIEILVRYRGEPHAPDLEDYEDIAGRVWVRNTRREYTRQRYDDQREDETLYGDTFVLRAKRRSETIKIPAAGHVDNDLLEVHIVAEDGEELDVEYIDVSTYRRQPDVRVIHRYARDYQWRPWYRYTYLYFYDGPFYYSTDLGYYIRWSYPIYDHHYLSIRYAYRNYLDRYYLYHPHHYYHYRPYASSYVNVNVRVDNAGKTRRRLNRWTERHETVRREYTRSRLSATPSSTDKTDVQTRVRSLVEKHRRDPVLADRVIQRSAVSARRERIDSATELSPAIKGQRSSSSLRDSVTRSYRGTLEKRRREYGRSGAESSTRLYDRSQSTLKRKRYTTAPEDTRSNAERRARLYNRSSSFTRRPSASPSRSQSSVSRESDTERKRTTSSRSVSRSQRSSTRRARSSTSTKDDDDEKKRRSERSRNTERTRRSRRN